MAKRKVLLIDDETDFLDVMGQRIGHWGYEVITATNGKEGVSCLKDEKPDIIIIDYIMPGLDGVATLKEIRKVNKKIPVIMFTAHTDIKSLKGAKKAGVIAFIPKLSAYTDIQTSLRSALDVAEHKLNK